MSSIRRAYLAPFYTIEPLERRVLLSAGDLDPTFGTGGEEILSGNAGTIAVQQDGKTLLSVDQSDKSFLERLNVNGTPDTSFGSGGSVTTSIGGSIALQPDGKIVLVGLNMARYNPDGSLDPTFGKEGTLTTQQIPGTQKLQWEVALTPDGKLLAAGVGTYQDPAHPTDPNYSATVVMAARYNADGTLDTSFNHIGYVFRQIATDTNQILGLSVAVAAEPDGKVLVGSMFKLDPAVWRFNADGSLDTSFGVGGMAWASFAYSDLNDDYDSGQISQLLLQRDGKILATGAYDNAVGVVDTWFLARFNANGSMDGAFGSPAGVNGPGVVTVPLPYSLGFYPTPPGGGVALQPDGKIVVGGLDSFNGNGPLEVRRFLPNGALDNSFHGSDIYFPSTPGNYATSGAMALAPDGRIVMAGNIHGSKSVGLVRLQGDQSASSPTPAAPSPTTTSAIGPLLDPSFGAGGRNVINDPSPVSFPDSTQYRVNATAVQSDGKIILAGSVGTRDNDGKGEFFLERLNADGSIDTTFGSAGIVETAFGPIAYATSILIQGDGKIVVGGASEDSSTAPTDAMFALARYNSNGSLDSGFGTNGKAILDFVGNEQIDDMALDGGKIVAVGSYFLYPDTGFHLVRYNANGSLDISFNGTGELTRDLGTAPSNSYSSAVAVQPDGRILVGARDGDDAAVYRFNSSGAVDTSFGTAGVATDSDAKDVTKLLMQPDGKILAGIVDIANPLLGAVAVGHTFGLARFNTNGSLDTSFNSSGFAAVYGDQQGYVSVYPGQGFTVPPFYSIAAIALQSDGKILVVGNQTELDRQYPIGSRVLVQRWLSNGSLDKSFADNGFDDSDPAFNPEPYFNGSTATAGALTPGGSLVVTADVYADSATSTPHWVGVAEYQTTGVPASGATSGGTSSGSGGTTGGGGGTSSVSGGTTGISGGTTATSGGTSAPPGQLAAVFVSPGHVRGKRGHRQLIRLRITNTATAAFFGPVSLSLHASNDDIISADDMVLTMLSISHLKLGARKSKILHFRVTYPDTLGAGSYKLLASLTETSRNFAPAEAVASLRIAP